MCGKDVDGDKDIQITALMLDSKGSPLDAANRGRKWALDRAQYGCGCIPGATLET